MSDILLIEYGKALPEINRTEGQYPVMGSNGITGYHNEYLVKAPTIIIGRKGSAGKITYTEKNCYPIDTAFYVINKTNSNLKLLYYILKGLKLENRQIGIGVPGINRNDIYNLEIPIPPIEAQEKIVSVIETVGEKIKDIDINLQTLESKKQATLTDTLMRKGGS